MRKILLLTGLLAVSLFGLFSLAVDVQAQDIKGNICVGAGCDRNPGPGLFEEGGIVRNVINVLLFVVGIIAVIMLIVGAIRYVTSGGDPNSTKGAKDTILYAIIGLIVAFTAFAIINFVVSNVDKPAPSGSINVTELV